jgi:hypothetical protein
MPKHLASATSIGRKYMDSNYLKIIEDYIVFNLPFRDMKFIRANNFYIESLPQIASSTTKLIMQLDKTRESDALAGRLFLDDPL